MTEVKVLGTGCANCRATTQRVEQVAKELGVPITLEKVEAIQDIMAFGILATPGRGGRRQGRAFGRRADPGEDLLAWLGTDAEPVAASAGHVRLRVWWSRVTSALAVPASPFEVRFHDVSSVGSTCESPPHFVPYCLSPGPASLRSRPRHRSTRTR